MDKLTKAQQALLSKATVRDDVTIVADNGRAGTDRVVASLLALTLIREVRSKPGMPVWREDSEGKPVSLVLTRAGRRAVTSDTTTVAHRRSPEHAERSKKSLDTSVPNALRSGTKQSLIIEMLSAERGATLEAMTAATGWLPHTMRAALTGLRKKGHVIERLRPDGAGSNAYRIVPTAKVP